MVPKSVGSLQLFIKKIKGFLDLADLSQPAGFDQGQELDLLSHQLTGIHFALPTEEDLKIQIRWGDLVQVLGVREELPNLFQGGWD